MKSFDQKYALRRLFQKNKIKKARRKVRLVAGGFVKKLLTSQCPKQKYSKKGIPPVHRGVCME